MSKRSAGWQGGEERYGAYAGQQQEREMSQQPQQATAAQLAKRKIASLKGNRRPRSESPITNGGSIFEQANQSGLMANNNNMPNQNNSFSSAPSFNFGTANTNGATTSSFGSGASSFNFGGTTRPTQPSTSSFTFGGGSAAPSTGSFTFGTSQAQEKQTNGQTVGSGFSFGQQPQENGTAQKPATSNIFGAAFGAQPTPAASNIFGSAPSQTTPSSNPFASMNNQTGQDGSTGFSFGGTSTTNEVKTPQAQGHSIFAGFGQTQAKPVEQPSSNGWASFLNQPAATTKPAASEGFTPASTSIFATSGQTDGQGQNNSQSIFSSAPSKTPTFKFGGPTEVSTADNDASMMSPENTPQKPSTRNADSFNTNGFSAHTPAEVPESTKPAFGSSTGKSLFDRITKDPPTTSGTESQSPTTSVFATSTTPASLFPASTPASTSNIFAASKPAAQPAVEQPKAGIRTSLFQPSTTKPASPTKEDATYPKLAPSQSTSVTATSMESTSPEHFREIRELNEGLLKHLQAQDLDKDWSSLFEYYQKEVKAITTNIPITTSSEPQTSSSKSGLGNSMLGKSSLSQPAASLFANSSTTPASTTSGLFGKSTSASSTEYPKLPDNVSATAKLFESTLDKASATPAKPASSLFASTPAASSLFSQTGSNNAATTSKPTASSLFAPPTNGHKSDTSSSTPAGGFVMPKPANPGSFLASFGQQAKANEEKEKKRRRDEDFDSDEDDAAEWEKKDAEEQAAKKAKIEAAAKSATGFVFKPSQDKPVNNTFGKSTGSSIFSTNGDSNHASEATQGEDHTWKQGTPIKFGGAPANTTTPTTPGTGLFGSSIKTSTALPGTGLFGSSIAPPSNSTGGLFGASSTPQTTSTSVFGAPSTSAQKSNEQADEQAEDGDAAPPEPQIGDMAVLLESELEENEVLYHVEKAKSRKTEMRYEEGKGDQPAWVEKGLGPIWILRNKSTGKVRVLQKVKDSGRIAMNFAVLKGFKPKYSNGKSVLCTFVDHLSGKDGSKPSSWQIQVGKADVAKEIDRILQEESKKA